MKRMRKGYAAVFMLLFVSLNLAIYASWHEDVSAFAEEAVPNEDAFMAMPLSPPVPSPAPATPHSEEVFFQFEVIRETPAPPPWSGKRVLIYHTHTYEAYTQRADQPYKQTEKWRTADEAHNVVAVGRALASALTALGVEVVHDATTFEPPNLDTAYARSETMLEERLAAGESYDLYIDLHRDAVASTSTIRRTVQFGGEEIARFMVLVGMGTTGGYAEKPDWEANQRIANMITSAMNQQVDGICRDVKIKTGRFNQHIANCCVLIECGMSSNTLPQVIAGVPYLAQAIAETLGK